MDGTWRRVAVTTLLCAGNVVGTVLPVHGSGYGIFTQGAAALGQADAVIAHGDGPSAVFFNPARINSLPGTQLEFGTTLIFPHREYTDSSGDVSHTKDSVFYPSSFYLTHALNDSISFGLGVFNPFGLGTDWGGDWPGRYIATRSKITTYTINPVVSWRVAPFLSIAVGLDVVLLDATLKNKIYTPSGDVKQKFTGDGTGLGYNLGLFIDTGKGVTIGASYRSEVKIDIDGKDEFSPAVYPDMDGKTSLKLPQQVFAGVAWQASDRLVVEAGMRWEDWSSFKQLRITLDQPGGSSTVATYPRNWHSTFAVNAGGKYRLNESFSVMAGYLYGWNPVPDSTFEPAIPDSDTHLFCLGGELRRGNMTLGLGYGYQLQKGRSKATNQYDSYANGGYESDLHLVALSLAYRF